MFENQMVGNEDDFFEGRLDDEEIIDYTEPYEPGNKTEDNETN